MNIGPYEVIDKLGESGMGIVYKAVQSSLRRTVAIKVPNEACRRSPELLDRFKREAEAAANMQDPNIVTVFEACLHEVPYYYAMEFLSRGTLKERVDGKQLDPKSLLPAFKALCHGLDAIHRRGLVHRDIKPDNLMADEHNRWKITDFGIVKDTDCTVAGTSTGSQFGTVPYMSPEQIEDSSKVTYLSDVYSAGATIYHALAGKPAFPGGIVTVMHNITQGKYEPLGSVRQDVKYLEPIVRKAMALRAIDRYQSCGEFYEELEHAVLTGKSHVPPPIEPKTIMDEAEPLKPGRSRLVPAAVTAVAALLIGFAVFAGSRPGPIKNSTTASRPAGNQSTEREPQAGLQTGGTSPANPATQKPHKPAPTDELPTSTVQPPKPPKPPPAEMVSVRVCSKSKLLPSPNCTSIITHEFVKAGQPRSICTICKPPMVSVNVCLKSGLRAGPDCQSTAIREFRRGSEPRSTCHVCRVISTDGIAASPR